MLSKVAIITGGSSGIGRAIAHRLACDGITVVIADVATDLEEVATALRQKGVSVLAAPTDVQDEVQVQRMVEQAVTSFGGVDILVNNAGILERGSVTELSTEAFDRTLAVNLKGAFLCIKHVAPIMCQRGGGVIVNISSIHAFATTAGMAAYAASKAGLVALTKAAALDLGKWNIRVVAVCPGAVDTPMLRNKDSEEEVEKTLKRWSQASPLSLVLQPEDVALLVAWLVSKEARGLTGVAILLDGGVTADLRVRPL